jgi:hypothetical protein
MFDYPRGFPMNKLLIGLALAAGVGFVAQSSASAADMGMKIELSAQNGSGETGYATLTPHGKGTLVQIHLQGGPAGVAQPAHIHPGTCDKLDPKPKFGLSPVKGGKSSTVVPASIDTLLASPMAINVHESAKDIKKYVACGDIKKSM